MESYVGKKVRYDVTTRLGVTLIPERTTLKDIHIEEP
jgi:hypothetical protein